MPPGVRAYSMDLRERIVAAVDAGLTQGQAAERFGVSLRTVERYLARRRVTGSLAATEQRHGPEADGAPGAAGLAAGPLGRRRGCHSGRACGGVRRRRPAGVAVGDVPGDRRAAARAQGAVDPGRAPATRGVAVEATSLTATERDETARARWRTQMGGMDPALLVFVDECGTHTSMTRRRARAARGARAHGVVPRNRGPVTTLLAGVSLAGMSPAMTVQGGTDTAVFATYLERFPAAGPVARNGGRGGQRRRAPARPDRRAGRRGRL
jgi:DDE superfamily endonuclease/Homeodomain-like domain-containing protein